MTDEEPTLTAEEIAEMIRHRRAQKGLTRLRLAAIAGCERHTISEMEQGVGGLAAVTRCIAVMRALDIDVEIRIRGAHSPPPPPTTSHPDESCGGKPFPIS